MGFWDCEFIPPKSMAFVSFLGGFFVLFLVSLIARTTVGFRDEPKMGFLLGMA